jgi:hypothetical protein
MKYTNKDSIPSFNDVPSYSYAHTRAASWFIGMNLGYYLFHTTQLRKDIAAGRRNGLSKVITKGKKGKAVPVTGRKGP